MPLFNIFLVSAVVAQVAWLVGSVFGLNGWGKALAVVALVCMCIFWFGSGIVAGIKQLEHTPIVRCDDGKEEVRYTLKFGPFGYTVTVPEADAE